MRFLIAAVAVACLFLAPESGSAETRRRMNAPTGPNKYYQRSAYAAAVYPRYQAQFHTRQLQNIGIPSGDIGLRGNSIFLQPW